jgi:hypothetical protein
VVVLIRQINTFPLAEGLRAGTDINGYIKYFTGDDLDELVLWTSDLKVQPPVPAGVPVNISIPSSTVATW